MSTPARRFHLSLTMVSVALVVAVAIGMVGGVWWVAGYLDDRSAERHDDVEKEQVAQVLRSRQGCERTLTDRAEGIQRDQDITEFALAAAKKNRQVGGTAEVKAAEKYERIARRAERRQTSARTRMLGADPMPARITADARAACAQAYPLPLT